MRIHHVIASLDPATGGPAMVASRLAAALAAAGESASLVAPGEPEREELIRKSLAGVPHIDRVTRHDVPRAAAGEIFRDGPTVRALEAILKPGDVLHLHGVWEPLLAVAARVARGRGCPYVLTPHGMLDPWSLGRSRWKKRLALAVFVRRMLNGAGALHALNDDEARLIGPLGLSAPVEVIPNGVFPEEIEPLPPPGEFRRKHAALGDRPYVLFLSRLHEKKGLDYLAEAFTVVATKIPDAHLVVAGPDGGARADFEGRIATAGLTGRTHVVGPLYGRDKLAALVDATCFCLPSRQEGFSVAITEALAAGLPVVISDACHFPEVAEAGAGRVVPLRSEAVAESLISVLAAEAGERARMGAAGRALVMSRYTWPRVAERALAVYRRLSASGGGRR